MSHATFEMEGFSVRDAEMRKMKSGKTSTSFSIAVNRGGKEDTASFFDLIAWEDLAEFAAEKIRKGSKVWARGFLVQDRWTDKDGKTQTKVKGVAKEIRILETASTKPKDNTSM